MTGTGATTAAIPGDHLDLFARPIVGVLTTMGCDGQPESSLVWADLDGQCLRVTTTLERQKANIRANPRVSLLVVDPDDTGRFVQVRGVAELLLDGAADDPDASARRSTTAPHRDGHVFPAAREGRETSVICRIHPRRVTVDAIHA